jgi:two-component system response regulator AtoC
MYMARSQGNQIDPADLPEEDVIFGCTAAMHEIRSKISSVLSSDLPVVIYGESGTGKEVIAQFLHSRSDRQNGRFVRLNCAAIPADQLEAELLGYEKWTITGSREKRLGLIEIADGGTLFVDEIAELPWDLQGKLLILLQDGAYCRVGGVERRHVGVRVICASNSELRAAVDAGMFREDLYDLIHNVTLRLPTLRNRKADIQQLSEHFLAKLGNTFRKAIPQLRPDTIQLLEAWHWPGNMRELENWMARAIILGDDISLAEELRGKIAARRGGANWSDPSVSLLEGSRKAASSISSTLILKILEANRWNRRKTASDLKISYRSLLCKLREVGVPQRRKGHRGYPPAN